MTLSFVHDDDRAFIAQLEGNRRALQILDDAGGIFEVRSANSVVICGVVTRTMTKAKKPSSAVIVTMAISLDAPRPLRKATRLCTNRPQGIRPKGPTGQRSPGDGFHMVNNR